LPVNFSLDQLGFLRPGAVPVSVLNHPPLIRMEAHSIAPLDHRIAKYRIPASALSVPGVYRISVRLRSRTEPMYFMRLINSTPGMIRRMNQNMLDVCIDSHSFTVHR
ncbi:MAG: cytochrome C, partial [Planctomycetota bacterium]